MMTTCQIYTPSRSVSQLNEDLQLEHYEGHQRPQYRKEQRENCRSPVIIPNPGRECCRVECMPEACVAGFEVKDHQDCQEVHQHENGERVHAQPQAWPCDDVDELRETAVRATAEDIDYEEHNDKHHT